MNAAAIARDERDGDAPGFVGAEAAPDEHHDPAVQAIALDLAEVARRLVKVVLEVAFDAIAAGADLGGPYLALGANALPR